jgi:hypothetical protein
MVQLIHNSRTVAPSRGCMSHSPLTHPYRAPFFSRKCSPDTRSPTACVSRRTVGMVLWTEMPLGIRQRAKSQRQGGRLHAFVSPLASEGMPRLHSNTPTVQSFLPLITAASARIGDFLCGVSRNHRALSPPSCSSAARSSLRSSTPARRPFGKWSSRSKRQAATIARARMRHVRTSS